jgi:hypothetical protein
MAGFCVSGNGHLDYVNDGDFGLAKGQVVSMLYGVTSSIAGSVRYGPTSWLIK